MSDVRSPISKHGSEHRARRPSSILANAIPAIAILLAILACGPGTPTASPGAEQTQIALAVQATSLADQAQQLTQQAGQPPPPPEPQAPTEAPPVQPTQTQPPPATATPTATATATATESPYVEGSMIRAAYDPAAGWGPPDVYEDFEGSSGLFATGSGSSYSGSYGDGRYHLTFATRGWWTWFYSAVETVNFYAEVLIFNGDQCVDRDSAGLMLRMNQAADRGFLFGVTCGGGYYIGITGGPGATGPVCTFKDSVFDNLSDFDCTGIPVVHTSGYIDAGPGALNRLGVKSIGHQHDVYVNGHMVGSLTFANLPDWLQGYAGLFLGAGQKDLSAVSFDDFSLWHNP